jgi:hypothetical protein
MIKKFLSAFGIIGAVAVLTISLIMAGEYLQNANIKLLSAESTEAHKLISVPFVHKGDKVPVTEVQRGEVFFVHNKYIKGRTCHVNVTNLLIDKKNKIAHHYSMFTNWFEAGTYEFNELFVMPHEIPPGHYNLIKKSTSFCGSQVFYTLNYDVEIDVK